jgi:type VI secretion system protein ImpE
MTAKQHYQAGHLKEALQALVAEVRDNPGDAQRRTFLFELLCFAGEYERAEKHLHVLAESNKQTQLGAMMYFSVIHGERTRADLFAKKEWPTSTTPDRDFAGSINGKPFGWIEDSDPRIGPRLEVFAAGAYLWIPFEHIVSIEIQPPKGLRDLLWTPAMVLTGPGFEDKELGEVLVPVLYPFSYKHENDQVKLGRMTEWHVEDELQIPMGQKTFLVDGEEFPLLEVRRIEFAQAAAA